MPGVALAGRAAGEHHRGRAYGAGPCPYAQPDCAKYAVAEVIGFIKGKSAIAVARQFGGRPRNFNGERFWARGYAGSTVGFEEEQIRAYIKHQEQLDAQGSDESGEF